MFLAFLVASGICPALGQSCSRDDFTKVVGEAAAALKALNDDNARAFQAKLRELKTKRGWTHDQFMKEAQPLVRDERIAAYDDETNAILTKINSLGEGGEGRADCKLLAELQTQMAALVTTTQAKWAYMFGKIAAALN
ncbi:MAG: hypothetical protein F9K44_05350 [Hyphomicrobiaceae bacterium]|nr:MAG: hypothetical protein F9K44_05350 [Hyphomicrobiaceae bacterium]